MEWKRWEDVNLTTFRDPRSETHGPEGEREREREYGLGTPSMDGSGLNGNY